MKTTRFLILGFATVITATRAFAVLSGGAGGVGATVGSSSLIDTLDYSDTYTQTAFGGNAGRTDGTFPVGAPGTNVEDNHGNPAQVWTNFKWSINRDATTVAGYPGGSGAGSATGITQTGGGGGDWGIEYNLRNDYLVQFDAVQTSDRIDITTGAVRDTIFNPGNVSFFFRAGAGFPSIGIYNGATETDTGFTTGLGAGEIGRWHNYAVRWNLAGGLASLYVDEGLRGTINLATFAGGAYSAVLGATGNDAVSVGYAGDASGGAFAPLVAWTDNFQVGGISVPEPSTLALIGLGLSGLWWMRRSRR